MESLCSICRVPFPKRHPGNDGWPVNNGMCCGKTLIFPSPLQLYSTGFFGPLSAVLTSARGRWIMPPKLPSSPGRPCLHPMRPRALLSPLHDPVMGELIGRGHVPN
jgi:hypothetical protein